MTVEYFIDRYGRTGNRGRTPPPRRVDERIERVQRGAEARLIPWALDLVGQANLSLPDLDGIAVAIGPGSFAAYASAWRRPWAAQAMDCPVWGATSLHHRGVAARGPANTLVMLDARKGRVYAGLYNASGRAFGDPLTSHQRMR